MSSDEPVSSAVLIRRGRRHSRSTEGPLVARISREHPRPTRHSGPTRPGRAASDPWHRRRNCVFGRSMTSRFGPRSRNHSGRGSASNCMTMRILRRVARHLEVARRAALGGFCSDLAGNASRTRRESSQANASADHRHARGCHGCKHPSQGATRVRHHAASIDSRCKARAGSSLTRGIQIRLTKPFQGRPASAAASSISPASEIGVALKSSKS